MTALTKRQELPVIVIGAGPVGLAAAAQLFQRNLPFLVLEAGHTAGAAMEEWAQVQLFSPWQYLLDEASSKILADAGWQAPSPTGLPTGRAFLDTYLKPLANSDALVSQIRYGKKVRAVGRQNFDKLKSNDRTDAPFQIHLENGEKLLARAVIDATGTWKHPNPIGAGGIPAHGEVKFGHEIEYGMPDINGARRADFAGKSTLVVGAGHSAMTNLSSLLKLLDDAPETKIFWALRNQNFDHIFGGGEDDELPARGQLGLRVKNAVNSGALEVIAPFSIEEILADEQGLTVGGDRRGEQFKVTVDRVIAATGFRPDLEMLREVRLELDPLLEAPARLAPMIDPNKHSCGSVEPHGATVLAHPDAEFFIVGMKSYGRAPTFLMAIGYEQARSIVAHLAGDEAAAIPQQLNLPQTGVCTLSDDLGGLSAGGGCCGPSAPKIEIKPLKEIVKMTNEVEAQVEESGCCGGPAPTGVEACCVKDADAKAAGESGCGCNSDNAAAKPAQTEAPKQACCG